MIVKSFYCQVIIIDWITKSRGALQTSDLQLAYKNDHSTTTCSLMIASKAFDRIRLDILFTVLLEREFPAPYIKILLNGYLTQNIRVK